MNRRDLLAAASALFLPIKSIFGSIFNKKYVKWPDGYDFEFEGTKCKFYIWPQDKMLVFWDGWYSYNSVMAPTFDLREVGTTLEENIRQAIDYYKQSDEHYAKYKTVYCSVIKYGGCDSQFAMICFPNENWIPKTSFMPVDVVEVSRKRLESRLHREKTIEGRWGEPIKLNALSEEEIDKKIKEKQDFIIKNQHLIGNANDFIGKIL